MSHQEQDVYGVFPSCRTQTDHLDKWGRTPEQAKRDKHYGKPIDESLMHRHLRLEASQQGRSLTPVESTQRVKAQRAGLPTEGLPTVQHGYSHTWEDLDRFTVLACTCGAEFRGEKDWQASGAFNSHIRAMIETAIAGGGDTSSFVDADSQIRTHESYRAELDRVYGLVTTWSERAKTAQAENATLQRQVDTLKSTVAHQSAGMMNLQKERSQLIDANGLMADTITELRARLEVKTARSADHRALQEENAALKRQLHDIAHTSQAAYSNTPISDRQQIEAWSAVCKAITHLNGGNWPQLPTESAKEFVCRFIRERCSNAPE